MINISIGVLTGGSSSERLISLESGLNIFNSFIKQGFDCELIDYLDLDDLSKLKRYDKIFIAMHGFEGESGGLQRELSKLGINYTGSNQEGCEKTWNKNTFKNLLREKGLATPVSIIANDILNFDYPKSFFKDNYFFLKPVADGSSIDTFEISSEQDFETAKTLIKNVSQEFLLEEGIKFKEFTVGILDNQILPVLEIKSPNAFYDYDAKYLSNKTIIKKADLNSSENEAIENLAINAFNICGCSGWGRVDILQAKDSSFYAIEINTVPGMTSHSLFPKAASYAGLGFDELVKKIISI